jgi:hypothetical protein
MLRSRDFVIPGLSRVQLQLLYEWMGWIPAQGRDDSNGGLVDDQ